MGIYTICLGIIFCISCSIAVPNTIVSGLSSLSKRIPPASQNLKTLKLRYHIKREITNARSYLLDVCLFTYALQGIFLIFLVCLYVSTYRVRKLLTLRKLWTPTGGVNHQTQSMDHRLTDTPSHTAYFDWQRSSNNFWVLDPPPSGEWG